MAKVLVIGLDGATLDLVEPWAKQGYLPVLAKMMNEGGYGRLRSVMPVLSSAAWPSFMTGMNPGKHSMVDFVRREPDSYRLRPVNRQQLRASTLWKILSQHNQKVGVLNVPMTYPPEEVNGFMVTGLGTPDYKPFTYPPELGKELLRRGYRVNKRISYHIGEEKAYINEINDMAERQLEVSLWLMRSQPWDFFMTVFFDTDQLAHFFWKHMDGSHPDHNRLADQQYADTILKFYQKIDQSIGTLCEAAGSDTNIFIISDHGTGPFYRDVFLNEWLRQQGYLVIEKDIARLQGIYRVLAGLGITRSHISSILRRNGLGKIERWIKDTIGNGIDLLPKSQRAEFPQSIDWSRTRAYSFGYQGQIYINLQGREPLGIVSPGEEYDQVCQEIMSRLLQIVDPQDDKPVIDHVYSQNELFHGPYLNLMPDLTLVMRRLSYNTRQGYEFSPKVGQIFATSQTKESGSHRPDGILISKGPDVLITGMHPASAHLIDLAPTILYLLGCPIPKEMDGQLLNEWITLSHPPQMDESNSIDYPDQREESRSYSSKEDKEIMDRLKNLGYLE